MEQKTKFIIIGLAAILVISLFINLQTNVSKQVVVRERNSLRDENASLFLKIEEGRKENQQLKDQINALNSDLDKILKEKKEIQGQYDLIVKERDKLSELVEELKTKATAVKEPASAAGDAYWAGILKEKNDLELQLENIRSELKKAQINDEELKSEKSALELDLKSLTQEKQDLEERVGYQQKVVDNISSERVLEITTKRQLQDRLNSLKNENMVLKRQLKSLSNYRAKLERKLVQLGDEKSMLERRFNEMSLLLEERLSQVGDLKQQVDTIRSGGQIEMPQPKKESIELPPIVVYPQAEKASPPQEEIMATAPSVGKILAVNKEDNFVIIDRGEDLGIRVGDTFQVYNEGKPIAAIEVMQIRRNIAACNIKTENTPIQVGDIVR